MSTRTRPGGLPPGTTTWGRRRRALAGLTAMTVAATAAGALTAGTAFAAVPTAPDNLLVFPNRDFITIEGYQSHKGEVATIELTRAGKVVGSAQGTVSGDDVAFEVNHPGGVCWGAGTGVNVTPDIIPGDVVTIKFGGTNFGDTTVQSATFPAVNGVPAATSTVNGGTLTVEGTIDPGNNPPDPANMEQRIVNADGFRTNLGKRDIRAVPGPLTASPKTGTSTYSSMLEITSPTTFKATYVFSDPAVAQIAKDGAGERLLQWQQVDAAANRQGVTIAEAGEVGGPGFGGCPAGPAQAAAPTAGQASVIRSTDKTSAKVTWTPATAQPGAAPVSAYSVEAIAATAGANGKPVIGTRTAADATSTTIAGLDPAATYDFEIRSMAGTGMSAPFTVGAVAGTPTGTPPPAGPAQTVAVTPKGGLDQAGAVAATSVTATVATGYQLFYTDDGSLVAGVDGPSNTAKLYAGPIQITKPVQLHIAAYDPDGNLAQSQDDGWYAPGATVAAPTGLKATAGQGQVTLSWTAVTGATGYQVVAYDTATPTPAKLATQPPASTGTTQVVTGLAAGSYQFAVTAKNAGGAVSPESTPLVPATVTAVTDTVSIGRVTWKAGQQLRVTGSDSLANGTVTIYAAKQDATGKWVVDTTRPLIPNVPLTSAAPAAGSTFDARGATTNTRPAVQVIAKSSGGGESPAVAVP